MKVKIMSRINFSVVSIRVSIRFATLPKLRLPNPRVFLSLLAIVLLTGFDWGDEIIKRPYLQNVSQRQVTIMWETKDATESRVDYGVTTDYDLFVIDYNEVKIHEVTLTSLKPETIYYYQISAGGDVKSSFFLTGLYYDTPFKFVSYGDNKGGKSVHRKIVEGFLQQSPDLIISTGDIVSNGERYTVWGDHFFQPLADVINHTPIYVGIGNHEEHADHYFNFLSFPNNELWYSFDYGNSHFIALDSNKEFAPDTEQYVWLENDLKSAKADWKFVFFHHPPYASGFHGSSLDVRDAFTPLFRKYGVDIVFNGHEHLYERTYPIGSAFTETDNPVTYVITGGGGAKLYDLKPSIWTATGAKKNHFCAVEIWGNRLTLSAIDTDGNLLDTFSIEKENDAYSAEYLATVVPYEQIELSRQLPANILPSEIGLIEPKAANEPLFYDVEMQVENPFGDVIAIEIYWNRHHWKIKPQAVKTILQQGEADKFLVSFATTAPKIYPIPTPTVRYKTRFGEGRFVASPLKIGYSKKLLCQYEVQTPKLDGRLKEMFWDTAEKSGDFIRTNWRRLASWQTDVRIITTEDALYLALVCSEKYPENLYAKATKRDQSYKGEDKLSIFIAPNVGGGFGRGGQASSHHSEDTLYEFVFNYKGVKYDAKNGEVEWNGKWQVVTTANKRSWTAEVKIPYGVLELLGVPEAGEKWSINFVRNVRWKVEQSEWTTTFGKLPSAKTLGGVLIFE